MTKVKSVRKKTVIRPPAQSALSSVRANIEHMQRSAEALLSRRRKEFEKLVRQTSKQWESRSKRFVSTLEKQVTKRIEPLVKRLAGQNLASRREVQSLSKHVQELEQALKRHAPSKKPVPPEAN